ncbi:uncharacterized protein G2W53_027294 [Senna tora]|uniref:Uncharacterized protein n=1 Tax=Senna tora TaxID=362788 RepID=A0A834WM38_9FABA|nr:uncharacterized protein G2W53_027294 [Senna tora]
MASIKLVHHAVAIFSQEMNFKPVPLNL